MPSFKKAKEVFYQLKITLTVCFLFLGTFCAFSQFSVSGKIVEKLSGKVVPNATVFLNNETNATKTDNEGAFSLLNLMPGSYKLVVTCIGFETYYQSITISNDSQNLGNIELNNKIFALKEVKIQSVNSETWKRNLQWFKIGFLGTTSLAKKCKILNPDVLNIIYHKKTDSLIVNSDEFIEVENDALGYKVKFLLENFVRSEGGYKISYSGPVLFEGLKGTPSQERQWRKKRKEVYEGSSMHFLRSSLANRLDDEGFRIYQLAILTNYNRPSDSLIKAKISQFTKAPKEKINKYIDSLEYWREMSFSPKVLRTIMNYPLNEEEFIKKTTQKGLFALDCANDGLFIVYNKARHFPPIKDLDLLESSANTTQTLINFNYDIALFDIKGWFIDPDSLLLRGAWGRYRVAGLLPTDYDPNQ